MRSDNQTYGIEHDIEEARFFADMFAGTRVMVILRGLEPEAALARASDAWDHGVRAVEVTVANESDLETLAVVAQAGHQRSMLVGAGSVYRLAQVPAVADLGADFTVAPSLDEGVSRACREAGLPHLPGVSTASEIVLAERLGHTWMKAFPASELGPGWITAMRAPFPWSEWVATGGIGVHNSTDYLRAGAAAIGMGAAIDDWAAAGTLLSNG